MKKIAYWVLRCAYWLISPLNGPINHKVVNVYMRLATVVILVSSVWFAYLIVTGPDLVVLRPEVDPEQMPKVLLLIVSMGWGLIQWIKNMLVLVFWLLSIWAVGFVIEQIAKRTIMFFAGSDKPPW